MPGFSAQAPTPTELSPDLQRLFAELADSDRRASEMVHALSNDQLNWKPSEAEWSIAQCLDHLAISNTVYSAALHRAIEEARQELVSAPIPLRPGVFGRAFIRSLEPPPKSKHRAPQKIVPGDRMDKDEVLRRFLESEEAMRTVIRNGARLDLNGIRFKNPFFWFLRFTVGTGLLIIAAHNRRHLWQAQMILDNPSFPK
ncbi:MAG: DinB family protein [Terracidiphilus sp.]